MTTVVLYCEYKGSHLSTFFGVYENTAGLGKENQSW